mgnify:CR=1 FL=1
MIQLSKRLNAVAELLVHGIDQLELEQPVLADIGTDHAYLPVYLVQKKVVKKAYAADVRKGPLLHAKEHIEQYRPDFPMGGKVLCPVSQKLQ